MDAAVAVVLLKLDGILSLGKPKMALRAFLGGQHCFALYTTGFAKSSFKQFGAQRLATVVHGVQQCNSVCIQYIWCHKVIFEFLNKCCKTIYFCILTLTLTLNLTQIITNLGCLQTWQRLHPSETLLCVLFRFSSHISLCLSSMNMNCGGSCH